VYQFFMQTADEDVERYLKLFTDLDDIADVMHEHRQAPEQRKAQTHLARHVTSFVHGDQATRQAEKASALLYGGGMEGATAQEILFAFDKNPRLIHLPRLSVLDQGLDRVALLSGACSSRAEANKLARSGGLYINGRAVQHAHEYTVSASDVVDNSIVILRVGKKRYHLIQLE
jgi:tyrosyl-tRNA synthetase